MVMMLKSLLPGVNRLRRWTFDLRGIFPFLGVVGVYSFPMKITT